MKRVLITGGNKGIGIEVTRLFMDKDYQVTIVARDFSDFPYKDKNNIELVQYDLSKTEGIAELVKNIGAIDILINNAGIMYSKSYSDYPQDNQNTLMNINLYTPVELIRQVSSYMVKAGEGRIVNTASIAGQIGHPDIWYGISKAGLINATKSFAKILGPKGIVINAVAPGPVETDMMKVIPEQRKKDIKSSVYTDRFARPEEVAETIYWLATSSPEYINGTCIDINNGAFPR